MVVLLNLVYEILDLQVEFGEFLVATLNLLLLFFVLFDQLQSAGFKIVLLSFKFTPVVLFNSESLFSLQQLLVRLL